MSSRHRKALLHLRAKQKGSPLCVASNLLFAWVRAGAWLSRNPSCNPCGFVGRAWAFAEPFVQSSVVASCTLFPFVEVCNARRGSQNLRASHLVATQFADPIYLALNRPRAWRSRASWRSADHSTPKSYPGYRRIALVGIATRGPSNTIPSPNMTPQYLMFLYFEPLRGCPRTC